MKFEVISTKKQQIIQESQKIKGNTANPAALMSPISQRIP